MQLHRITRRLSLEDLQSVLCGASPPSERLDIEIDLSACQRKVAAGVAAQREGKKGPRSQAQVDQLLVADVFEALKHLDRRTATDVRVWHWIALVPLRDLTWLRWNHRVPDPEEVDEDLVNTVSERFLGSASYRGLTHNAVGRLYWTVRFLAGDDEPDAETYRLAAAALGDTDLHAGIFDREYCAYPPVPRALVRVMTQIPGITPGGVETTADGLKEFWQARNVNRSAAEKTKRDLLKRLNHRFAGMVLESLDQSAVEALIEEELTRLLAP